MTRLQKLFNRITGYSPLIPLQENTKQLTNSENTKQIDNLINSPNPLQYSKYKEKEIKELVEYIESLKDVIMPNPDTVQSKNGGSVIYKDMILDPIISGLIDARKSGITKLELQFNQNEANDVEYEFIKDYFDLIDTQTLISNALDCLFYGYAVFEIIWGEYKGYQVPVEFKYWNDYDLFAFGINSEGEETLYFIGNGDEIELPADKFIVVRNGASVTNPYGNALLSKIYWLWFFKKNVIAMWVKYIEKYGLPFVYATLDNISNDSNDKLKGDIITQLRNMINSSVGVLNKNVQIDSIDNSNGKGDVFKEFIAWVDGSYAVNIMGHNAAASATPGSLGNNAQAEDTITRLIDGDKKLIENFLDTIIEYIYKYNFNIDIRQPDAKLYEQSTIDLSKVTRDSALYTQGVRFTKEYYIKTYDDITEEDIEIAEPQSIDITNKKNIFNFKGMLNSNATDKHNTELIKDFEDYINENVGDKYIEPIINKIIYELSDVENENEALSKLDNMYKDLKKDSEDYRDTIEKIINISTIVGINAENEEIDNE